MNPTRTDLLTPLVDRELAAERTMSFRFERPADWAYRAGQYVDLTLIDPPETDAEGDTRTFTVSAAPREHVIQVTTRLRDTAFKRALQTMPLGTPVKVDGPHGSFRLHASPGRPAVLLAGGIGITPFRSILVEAVGGEGLPYPVALFYANRRPEDAAFLEELYEIASNEPRLIYVPTMTSMERSERPWSGERGRIDPGMLRRHASSFASPIYYLAGPPEMVAGLQSMLSEAGVSEDDVRTEEFAGY